MKNIVIHGASRSGKTSLAKRIKDEFHLNVVNVDHLINTFEQAFPQLGISVEADYTQAAVKVTPFITHYLGELARHAHERTGSNFVVDLTFFDFDSGIPLLKESLQKFWGLKLLDEFMFISLINNVTSEELFNAIRKYDTPEDWSYGISDDDLRRHCEKHAGMDWAFYEKWQELGFRKYDVAAGREKVFDRIVEDLKGILVR